MLVYVLKCVLSIKYMKYKGEIEMSYLNILINFLEY